MQVVPRGLPDALRRMEDACNIEQQLQARECIPAGGCSLRNSCLISRQPALPDTRIAMRQRIRDPKYYAVGGPVQPDRDCYQQRTADAELLQRIVDREYCCVLAPRQSGKTSLAAHAARILRESGTLLAMVDLVQASREDPSENSGRWYYSIVYRIVRDLRIRADVQTWWKERASLTNLQRMREFFLEIVLAETTQPVVIFLDQVEAAASEPLAQDLFTAIRSCYDARANDANFQRLTFVLLGSGAPAEIVKSVQGSPFEIATPIALDDLTAQEMAALLVGLGEPLPDAQAILTRVYTWTRGHPYLTQKVLRSLARRRDEILTAAQVDELVQTQFLTPNSLRDELHLSALAESLTVNDSTRTARLNCYGRIRKGANIIFDSNSAAQRELLSAGLVKVGEGGVLRVRNEIYAAVFAPRWINHNLPYGSRKIGVGVAAVMAVLVALVWYVEYLPRPYIRAMTASNQDLEAVQRAYQSLVAFPGHGAAADRMFGEFLTRSGQTARTFPEMQRLASAFAALPEGAEQAQLLLADFWERQAVGAARLGDRDAALLQLLEAMQSPTDYRRRLGGELVGQSYRNLVATLHTEKPLRNIEVDVQAGVLMALDAGNNVDIWQLDGDSPRFVRRQMLTAEELLSVEDRRSVTDLNGWPSLLIKTDHPRPAQVSVLLRSPSGQEARLQLAAARVRRTNVYAFDFSDYPSLRALLATGRNGNWTLVLGDTERGLTGDLLDWGIVGPGVQDVATRNVVPQPIPELRTAPNALSQLGPGGKQALAWPADSSTQGPILVWDIEANKVLARLPRSADFIDVRMVLEGKRVMTLEPRTIRLWDAISGGSAGKIDLDFAPDALTLSENGRFLALKTVEPNDALAVVVWDLEKVRQVGRPVKTQNIGAVAIDAAGQYLAIAGSDSRLRVWSLQKGSLIGEYGHTSPLRSVQFSPSGEWLVTDDFSSTFRLWNLKNFREPLLERSGNSPWLADFSADSMHLLYGSSERVYDVISLREMTGAGIGLQQAIRSTLSPAGGKPPAPVMLAERNLAVTNDADRSIKIWSIPDVMPAGGEKTKALPGFSVAALSKDSSRIAVASGNGEVQMFAAGATAGTLLDSGEENQQSAGDAEVVQLQFSGDRSLLAGASLDGRLLLWTTLDGQQRQLPVIHADGAAHDLVFLDGNRYLVSVSRAEVIVSDIIAGQSLARLRIQSNHPQLAIAQLTGQVFVADDLGGVTAWNWQTGEIDRLNLADSRIRKIAVTADGKRLLSASDQQLLTLWDVDAGTPLQQSVRAAGKVDDLQIVADGTRAIVQAGPWLQELVLAPTGVIAGHTRLLPFAPSAIQPEENGLSINVLKAITSQPVVQQLRIDTPGDLRLNGDPAQLRSEWRKRLAMALDDEGRVQLVAGDYIPPPADPVSGAQ